MGCGEGLGVFWGGFGGVTQYNGGDEAALGGGGLGRRFGVNLGALGVNLGLLGIFVFVGGWAGCREGLGSLGA